LPPEGGRQLAFIETIEPNPQVAAFTFLHHTANEHFPGCPCPGFHHLVKASPFAE
jgi:hypothetical protein